MLRDAVEAGRGALVLKKPTVPTRAEILKNRRARSAKLRVFERVAAPVSEKALGAVPAKLAYV